MFPSGNNVPQRPQETNEKHIPRILWIAVREQEDAKPDNQPRHMKDLFDRNKNWDIRLVWNEEKDRFMNTTFAGTSLLWAYHAINPVCGAAKADIWRYAVLWIFGGVYIDDDSDMIAPLDDVVTKSDYLIAAFEKNGFNGNRCFVPRYHLSDFSTFDRFSNISVIPEAARKEFQFVILNWAIMAAPRHLMMEHAMRNLVEVVRYEYLREEVMRNLNAEYGW